PERMDIAVAGAGPVDELDPELVGRVRLADELVLVDPEHAVEHDDLRDGRLAHAHGADRLAFDQLDGQAGEAAHDLGQRRRGHPPGGSAADDDNLADRLPGHAAPGIRTRTSAGAHAFAMRRNCSWEGRPAAAEA